MIRIKRERKDEKGDPIRPEESWFERSAEKLEEALLEGPSHEVDRNVYADDRVRRALEKQFYDKCAYCEGDSSGQADWDVEHFRPKGRVAERKDHDGYYWLAYAWENLYPSCQHCNQRRRDRPRWGDTSLARGPGEGKLDQFPLGDETTRAMSPPEDLESEARLLLDPCSDRPEDHIRFEVSGKALAVAGSLQGKVSISVCHLNRKRLKDQRKRTARAVIELLRIVGKIERRSGPSARPVRELREVLKDHHLADSVPFAAVARWVERDPESFGV